MSLPMDVAARIDFADSYIDDEVSHYTKPKNRATVTAWAIVPVFIITSVYAHQEGESWIPQVAALFLAGLWLIADVLLGGRGIVIVSPWVFFAGWMAWELVANLTSSDPFDYIAYGELSRIKVFVLAFIISNTIRSSKQFVPMCMAAAITPLILMVIFRQDVAVISQTLEKGTRATSIIRLGHKMSASTSEGFGNANELAFFAAHSLIASIMLVLLWKGKLWRWFALATIPPTLAFIIYTGSRMGIASVPVLGFAFWFLYLRIVGRGQPAVRAAVMVVTACMVVGFVGWVLTTPFADRFGDDRTSYGNDRGPLTQAGLMMFMRSPIIGNGMFGYQRLGPQYGVPGKITVAHNTFIEMLVRGGLPGFALYYGAWFVFMRQAWRLRKLPLPRNDMVTVNMVLLYCIVFHWFCLTGTHINPRVTWMVMGACIGYTYGLQRDLITSQAEEAYGV